MQNLKSTRMDSNPDFFPFLLIFVNLRNLYSQSLIYNIHVEGRIILPIRFSLCVKWNVTCLAQNSCSENSNSGGGSDDDDDDANGGDDGTKYLRMNL